MPHEDTLTEPTDTLPSNHLTHLPTQKQIICCPRETSNIKDIQRPSLLDHSPSPSSTQSPPWGDLWGCRGGRALPTPIPSPNTLPAGHCALGRPGLTHKVRSLGMWLKLDTGMVVMLLLFRVLSGVGGGQDYGSGMPFPSPGHLPDSGIEPVSPALTGKFFTTKPPGKSFYCVHPRQISGTLCR